MGKHARRLALLSLLAFPLALAPGAARADERTGASSVDAVAKQRENDFEDLQKKKGTEAALQRLKILDGLQFADCGTSRRFLLALLKKASSSGDERAEAVRTLCHIADESALEALLATLTHDKDPTLWQVFSDGMRGARSKALETWRKGAALASRDADMLGAVLDAGPVQGDAAALEKIEALYAKHQKAPGPADTAARALAALVAVRGAAERPRLLEAVRSTDPRVRLVAADTLPGLEPFDAEVEAAVRGLLQDESAAVRQSAAARAGAAKRTGLAPSLITLLGDPRVRTRHVAAEALQQATGQALGHDAKAWAAWFAKQDPGKPEELTFPTYHGFSVETDRVVFLVDASSSMTWPSKSPHRIDVARTELAAVLGKLTPETQFNVMVYADERAWFRKAPLPANPESVAAAVSWAEKALAEPKGDTRMFEALETSFASDPQFDTLFLLTDGNPTNGRYWAAPNLVASVRAWNRHRRAAIHTIGLSLKSEDPGHPNLAEDPLLMAAVLSGLAAATGGEYREILNAPVPK